MAIAVGRLVGGTASGLSAQVTRCGDAIHLVPPFPSDTAHGPLGLCPGDVDSLATVRPVRLPVFPPMLASAKVDGTVVLRFTVNERGRIDTTQIKVLRSTHELFTAAARAALVHWRATPARLRGRRVAQWSDINFSFEITCPKPAPHAPRVLESGGELLICPIS
ncbi:MAG: energy transducer TonB [Gemmatimonadaceae bacterium]